MEVNYRRFFLAELQCCKVRLSLRDPGASSTGCMCTTPPRDSTSSSQRSAVAGDKLFQFPHSLCPLPSNGFTGSQPQTSLRSSIIKEMQLSHPQASCLESLFGLKSGDELRVAQSTHSNGQILPLSSSISKGTGQLSKGRLERGLVPVSCWNRAGQLEMKLLPSQGEPEKNTARWEQPLRTSWDKSIYHLLAWWFRDKLIGIPFTVTWA